VFDILEFLKKHTKVVRTSEKEIFLENCPNCGKAGKHAWNFSVSRTKMVSHCFRCGKSYRWEWLVAKFGHMSAQEATRLMGAMPVSRVKQDTGRKILPAIMPPRSGWTIESELYLRNRGISEQTQEDFGLYYCSIGKYARRIIVPVTLGGIPMTFQARSIDKNVEPRYRSPFDSPKRHVMLNLDRYRGQKEIVLVEGPFDILRLHEHGIYAVSPLGKSLSKEQINLLTNLPIDAIVIMQDKDALSGIGKLWKTLRCRFSVKIAPVLDGNDPGDMNREIAYSTLASTGATPLQAQRQKIMRWKKDHDMSRSNLL
jgi:hypothetical protein